MDRLHRVALAEDEAADEMKTNSPTAAALSRVALVAVLTLAVIGTLILDPYLRRWVATLIGNPVLADAASWIVRLAVWLLPLALGRRFWDIGTLRLPSTWTVLLVLPYLLLNVLFFRGFPEGHLWVQCFLVGMAIGTWEELIFRGYALSRCEVHPRFALCVSALGFAFLHLGHAPANIITVFFVAIGFGILRVVSGSLGWCILIHGLTNVPADGAQLPDWAIIPAVLTATVATLITLWHHPGLGKLRSSANP